MDNSPVPTIKSAQPFQKARNREASHLLEKARQVMILRDRRHSEILQFTKKFLEKPNKGFFGRFLYDVLWRTAEKMNE